MFGERNDLDYGNLQLDNTGVYTVSNNTLPSNLNPLALTFICNGNNNFRMEKRVNTNRDTLRINKSLCLQTSGRITPSRMNPVTTKLSMVNPNPTGAVGTLNSAHSTDITEIPIISDKDTSTSQSPDSHTIHNLNMNTSHTSGIFETNELDSHNSTSHSPGRDESERPELFNNSDPINLLNKIRISNANRLIIGQLNINSLRYKFDALKTIIRGKMDILVITETKLDDTFPTNQFLIDGFSLPYRFNRDRRGDKGGGVFIYVREDIPCRELKSHKTPDNFEGIFLEINLRKIKWLLFGGYNPHRENTPNFLTQLTPILDYYLSTYDNYLLLGDFNSETQEETMKEFCDTYNLTNLIKEPTCFKNPLNPSSIDLILTNRTRRFQDSHTVETGLSDCHKMTITVLKTFFQKQSPTVVKYRDYKNFDEKLFRNQLLEQLTNIGDDITYEIFEKKYYFLAQLARSHENKKY